jgi:MFS family permease
MTLRRNRDFVLLQAGQLLSSAGSSLTTVAYPLLVLSLTHSPAKAGFVSFARLLPLPLFGLPAGVAADRWNRRTIMLAADVVRACAMGTLALVVFVQPVYALIPILAFVEGTGDAFFSASSPGALRAVVPAGQLPAAISVQQARGAAVGIVGPPAGGILFTAGRALPFLADSISYSFSFVSLLAMHTPFQSKRGETVAGLRAQLREGFSFLWRQPFLRTTSFLYAIGNVTIPAVLFVVVVAGKEQGLGGGAIGALLAAFSGLILVGSAVSQYVRARASVRTIMLAELYLGLGVLLFLIWPNVFVLVAAILPQAAILPITDSVVISRRIAITPDRLLGRVEAARATLARTAQPLGPLAAGILLGWVSSRATVAVFALGTLALCIWGTLSRGLREVPELR